MVGGQDEDLVDPAGRGLGEHRAQVGDDHRGVAVERRVQVGYHPHQPLAPRPVGLEGRQGRLLVAPAERARAVGVALDRQARRQERKGPV